MKKRILLIVILFCTAFAQAQEVFVTADFVSSYIWRGMDSGNASVQPSLGLNWKGLTVYAWGSTEFRSKLVHDLCRKRLPGKRETCLVQLLRVELPVQREGCKYEYRSRFHSLGKYVLRQIQCSQYRIICNKRYQNNVQLLFTHLRKANSQPL